MNAPHLILKGLPNHPFDLHNTPWHRGSSENFPHFTDEERIQTEFPFHAEAAPSSEIFFLKKAEKFLLLFLVSLGLALGGKLNLYRSANIFFLSVHFRQT